MKSPEISQFSRVNTKCWSRLSSATFFMIRLNPKRPTKWRITRNSTVEFSRYDIFADEFYILHHTTYFAEIRWRLRIGDTMSLLSGVKYLLGNNCCTILIVNTNHKNHANHGNNFSHSNAAVQKQSSVAWAAESVAYISWGRASYDDDDSDIFTSRGECIWPTCTEANQMRLWKLLSHDNEIVTNIFMFAAVGSEKVV